MRTRYDSEHDILYIDVIPDRKAHDTQPLNEDILVDLDEEGNIVGIEIWQASKNVVEPVAEQLVEKVKRSLEAIAK
ncbi:MAG: DUF2283 domain-containing protein [Candidatus Brockarchaeota archaeon]|nr:DUF2283 domain-containing protein [Candidatus Brockarchaeota archaeon]